ncbi:hypothetical protein DPMN_169996 [Dreissena polymorpha]|uniref:Uncharacterized protein n=1 Tax=Dreissena polymorpha TaxID=45954 RepID=A0A9D4DYQ1_DREPO|nr:hypothetical protein DPMN_169996 [Dreissena polymorpha]
MYGLSGSCVLREGDRVTFGHPTGMRIPAGSRVRQPDSEHQFMVRNRKPLYGVTFSGKVLKPLLAIRSDNLVMKTFPLLMYWVFNNKLTPM